MNSIIENNDEIKIIKIRSNESIGESNLMVLPFISMSKTKVDILEREWISNGVTRKLTVKGSADLGCPTIDDLDVLLALFRILLKNNNYTYEYNTVTKKVNLPRIINFTYGELAKELGYKYYGGTVKRKLEKSIKTLVETTMYSNMAVRDAEVGEYIIDLEGEKSLRILFNYKSYSYKARKRKGEPIEHHTKIKEQQSVEIDDFLFKSVQNNYFKIYNYVQYTKLKKGISKKLYLLLNQWSKGTEKYLKYQTLYDYLALDVEKGNSYNNREIKKALDELEEIRFIQGYERSAEGINLIFNRHKLNEERYLQRYNSDEEVIQRLRDIGFTLDELTNYYRLDNMDYVQAMLRYIDERLDKGKEIKNVKNYLIDAITTNDYDVYKFIK